LKFTTFTQCDTSYINDFVFVGKILDVNKFADTKFKPFIFLIKGY